ncbi:MAG TPA: AbrB/MazE/SpoVT family DNA-binding domain-containing protein [Methanosphaera sp.]|nr:AbrB/MazE/SpoVT family DNA-binding domain-containing protein [Methanosphaera sp.]HII08788.1 AbrB/MazE/SpoVT family DNA-binding domain-containing protein [Methanosphaera sp.]HIJ15762.1 AbrB/MazE/SpoVT family DNA-binding domain-containing protein [Methanosphaera sp.]
MRIETRINQDLQTIIPKKFAKEHNLKEGDIVRWEEKENGEVTITFKKSDIFNDN